MRTVGAYEAKTHLPRLLDEVAEGQAITITKHGIPVAVIVPAGAAGRRPPPKDVIEALRQARAGVTLGGLGMRQMIEEADAEVVMGVRVLE